MTKKEKIQKSNLLFFASSKENSQVIFKLYTHTKEHYKKVYKSLYKRHSGLFFLAWIFAIQKNLPKEIVEEISEYSFKKHVTQLPEKFCTRYWYNILGKIYFIQCYTLLKKHNINTLYLYDDTTIINKACIIAAQYLKIDVKIIHEGYKNNILMIDGNATRWHNSIPRNQDLYQNLNPNKTYITQKPQQAHNIVLVLLQNDLSPETILHSPWVLNQKHLVRIIGNLAKNLPQTQFIIFNAESPSTETQNLHFTTKPLKEFLPFCKCVITINNQQALEALEEQKPIITLGNCYFNIYGITQPVGSEKQLLETLQNIENIPFNTQTANGFLYCLNDVFSVKLYSVENPQSQELDAILKYN